LGSEDLATVPCPETNESLQTFTRYYKIHFCAWVITWRCQCLTLYSVSFTVFNEWWIGEDWEENSMNEVPSRHLPGENEKNCKRRYNLPLSSFELDALIQVHSYASLLGALAFSWYYSMHEGRSSRYAVSSVQNRLLKCYANSHLTCNTEDVLTVSKVHMHSNADKLLKLFVHFPIQFAHLSRE